MRIAAPPIAFAGFTAVVVVAARRIGRWGPLREVVHRLENTSSQLRVRLAITFALAFAVVAEHFGLATILGAFLAGIIVRRTGESPAAQEVLTGKLEAIGFGFLIPVFMQATSLTFIVVATIIGVETNHQRSSTATALVVAGLLSVIIYPPIALHLLNKGVDSDESRRPAPALAPAQPAPGEEPP